MNRPIVEEARSYHLSTKPPFFYVGVVEAIAKDEPFPLTFDPSGDTVMAQIEDGFIVPLEKKEIVEKWILEGIFQLQEGLPLTEKRMTEVGINGFSVKRIKGDASLHISFIWIDEK